MFENIKDGDLVTLKLASGEEVIANYKSGADSYISIPQHNKINQLIYRKTKLHR